MVGIKSKSNVLRRACIFGNSLQKAAARMATGIYSCVDAVIKPLHLDISKVITSPIFMFKRVERVLSCLYNVP